MFGDLLGEYALFDTEWFVFVERLVFDWSEVTVGSGANLREEFLTSTFGESFPIILLKCNCNEKFKIKVYR